jgi:hypothetical protein
MRIDVVLLMEHPFYHLVAQNLHRLVRQGTELRLADLHSNLALLA